MAGEHSAPIFFFAPFVSSTMRVEPGWIDYNGHLNVAYYGLLFDRAAEEGFAVVGLGQDYVEARRASHFIAEAHVLYRRELKARDAVRATLQLVDYDEKRLHFYMELRHAAEGWVAASCEELALHVDIGTRKVVPFPGDILDNLAVMRAAHRRLSRPAALGRIMGLRRAEEHEPMLATGTRH